jgi:hypothetical protein
VDQQHLARRHRTTFIRGRSGPEGTDHCGKHKARGQKRKRAQPS